MIFYCRYCPYSTPHFNKLVEHYENEHNPGRGNTLPVVIECGYVATPVKARREFACTECKGAIQVGDAHYSVVIAGGGLGSLKFPDRVHQDCLEKYLNERNQDA